MKRTLFCTLIMALAVSLAVMAGTKAEAASSAEARRAEEVRKTKKAVFIAVSNDRMTWADAEAYCRRQGGKLPRIDNSASWDGRNPPAQGIAVDGFGYKYRPWDEVGLPKEAAGYWTGTALRGTPGAWWMIDHRHGSKVYIEFYPHNFLFRAACVP